MNLPIQINIPTYCYCSYYEVKLSNGINILFLLAVAIIFIDWNDLATQIYICKIVRSFSIDGGKLVSRILKINPSCQTVSYALDISLIIRVFLEFSLKFKEIFSLASASACVVPLLGINPNCCSLKWFFSFQYYYSLILIIFSNNFPGTSNKEIGL